MYCKMSIFFPPKRTGSSNILYVSHKYKLSAFYLRLEKEEEKCQDFNSYVNGGGNSGKGGENGSLADMISSLAGKYNGASEADLMRAIVKEAEKGKRNGTLSNEDIDRFAAMLSPMLDDKKRAYLKKVVSQLKNI